MYIKESLKMTVAGDEILKSLVRNQESLKLKWRRMYGWMPQEYINLQKTLEMEVSQEYFADKPRKISDPRTVLMRPFPQTTTGEIGWLSGKREFLLDKWGKDNIMQPDPIPEEFLV